MYTLHFLLSHQDVPFRQVVAEAWGLENPEQLAHDPEALTQALLAADFTAMWRALPEAAQEAFLHLLRHGGAMAWEPFLKAYGPLRPMGPLRLARERPHERPASPLEALWYRALVGRGLHSGGQGLEERAYIPLEWQEKARKHLQAALQTPVAFEETKPLGRPAVPEEIEQPRPAAPYLAYDLVTVLAGLRQQRPWAEIQPHLFAAYPEAWLFRFLEAWGLVAEGQPRPEALAQLFRRPFPQFWLAAWQAWLDADFHDIEVMKPWKALDPIPDPPQTPRHWLRRALQRLPVGTWWSWPAFLDAVAQRAPDFARSRSQHRRVWRFLDQGRVLASAEDWMQVDGALLRFLVFGPFHWFGVVETAGRAFRLSPYAPALLQNRAPALPRQRDSVLVRADGRIVVPAMALPVVRYQIARATAWEDRQGMRFVYRLDPDRLRQAQAQGLSVERLLRVLYKAAPGVPKPVRLALERWSQGKVARLETWRVLRLPEPAALHALQRSPLGKDILRVLSEEEVLIRGEQEARFRQVLWEMGYFVENS